MSDATIGQVGPQGNTLNGPDHARFVGQTAPEDADMISGFCFMLRASTFHGIGGFDIVYTPASYEETDFSMAIRGEPAATLPRDPPPQLHALIAPRRQCNEG